MSDVNLPSGLTDNPPTTLSARELFEEWMHRDEHDAQGILKDGRRVRYSNGPHEYVASDSSFMLWVGLYDFDYKRGYLFEIRSGEGGAQCDWLFAWERYGGKNDFDVEWQNTACHVFFDEHFGHTAQAMHRLPEWCLSNLETDSENARRERDERKASKS